MSVCLCIFLYFSAMRLSKNVQSREYKCMCTKMEDEKMKMSKDSKVQVILSAINHFEALSLQRELILHLYKQIEARHQ